VSNIGLASGGRPHSPLRGYPQKSPMDQFTQER
jgi:hypothetical protein